MKLTIFAATGGIGRQVLEQTLATGHDVKAVVRNPKKPSRDVEAHIVTADLAAADPAVLESAVAGADRGAQGNLLQHKWLKSGRDVEEGHRAHAPQPADQGVLREAPWFRQAQEGGFGGLYAQAGDHPQRDVKKPYPLEVFSDPGPLILETVASSCLYSAECVE